MSVSAGSARALCSLPAFLAADKTHHNPDEEAARCIIGDSRLRVQVKNTFISLESPPSPLGVRRARARARTWSFESEPRTARTWSFESEPHTARRSSPPSSPSGASGGTGAEGAPAEESGDRTPVPFCSTPSPRAPATPLSFTLPPAPPPAPPGSAPSPAQPVLQPVLAQALLMPAIWPSAAPTSTWLAPPCAAEGSLHQGPGARRSTVGGRSGRPPSVPTVPLQSRLCSTVDGYARIRWTVDARKLNGSDKQLVSPPLGVDLGLGSGPVTFKIILTASWGSTFRKSGGIGCVQVKCCSELGEDACTKVRIAIGREERGSLPRGPVTHCFSSSPVFGLPKELAEWDFRAAAERQSNSMVVNVDITPLV